MSKGIILYQSKYGATKKYAEWLRDETALFSREIPTKGIPTQKINDLKQENIQ